MGGAHKEVRGGGRCARRECEEELVRGVRERKRARRKRRRGRVAIWGDLLLAALSTHQGPPELSTICGHTCVQ